MRPILKEPCLDFHKYSQRHVQILEFSWQATGLELSPMVPLSLSAVVLSFKRSYRAFDGPLRSRHPGENRGPDILQVFEESGFRLPPE